MSDEKFDILLDASRPAEPLPDGIPVLDLPPGHRVDDAADALESLFLTDRTLEDVVLCVGGRIVGITTRAYLTGLGSPVLRSVGDGDGATLPGESLRYEILRYRCPSCDVRLNRVHVDTRSAPRCPNGHGDLELQR
ncbi:hypothetical protein [Streptomyces geranii]|uniref:hypothetical protein n=1 Tax=Streptomyces geranii TaxID=2058923 RepID=UPI000D033A7D|nr:hypothetical protein [Streptomyces geranii]